MSEEQDKTDAAGDDLAGGSYEVIRSRLLNQAADLGKRTDALNQARQEAFGGSELTVIGNERVRTANNCVPRDIVQVGGRLLFAYNVFIGLRPETTVADVLALHTFEERAADTEDGEGFDLGEVPAQDRSRAFLEDRTFLNDFGEVYKFYKEAKLVKLSRNESKLLAVFQIGLQLEDVRAFRWSIDVDGNATYIDNRGERDHDFPPQHDFEWTLTTREDHRSGKHPHVSILDQLFVETVGGDLTIKVEDNTESGQGIYAEPVDDPRQSLDDAEIHFAQLGTLIVLKVRPYREETTRHLVFATRSKRAVRIDAIGEACVQLPEDHGIIFPGGYFLQDGQSKVFDGDFLGYEFERTVRSPNGEDVLYVFHHRQRGAYALFPYNLIRKEVQNPILANGYSLFDDGRMVVFRLHSDEPTRVHGMQIWQTPFSSAEHAAQQPRQGGKLGKIGNAELVRGISEAYSIKRSIDETEPSRQIYEDLIAAVTRVGDAYHWLDQPVVGQLSEVLHDIRATAELVVDEFDKVQAIKARAVEAVEEAEQEQALLIRSLRPDIWDEVEAFMKALTQLRSKRGHLISLKEMRYVDLARIETLEAQLVEQFDRVSGATITFLQGEQALTPLASSLEGLLKEIEGVDKSSTLKELATRVEETGEGLEVLSQIVGGLEVDDPTIRTEILERISEVFGQLNRTRATVEARRRALLSNEGRAEFGAQFKLFSQSVSSALGLATTPDKADEQLSRLMVQLEELEGRFSEFDEFIAELATKREEVYEALSSRKQALLDERARKAQNLFRAAERILQGVGRRAKTFKESDELNAYFASDPMLLKLRELKARLIELGDGTKADEVDSQLKTARQGALRGLRDRTELFEGDENLIRFGQHRFTTNTQTLELTMLPDADGGMQLALSGTDYRESIADPAFEETRPFWDQQLPSEDKHVYRGEFLAASIFFAAESGEGELDLAALQSARHDPEGLIKIVRKIAAERYDEGYERGLHDADSAAILDRLLSMRESVGLLRFSARARAVAILFWAHWKPEAPDEDRATPTKRADLRASWQRRAQSLGRVRQAFGHAPGLVELGDELAALIANFAELNIEWPDASQLAGEAGRYLVEELSVDHPRFVLAAGAEQLRTTFLRALEELGARAPFEADLAALQHLLPERLETIEAWVDRYIDTLADDAGEVSQSDRTQAEARVHRDECIAHIATFGVLDRDSNASRTQIEITGLLGHHPRIEQQTLPLRFDEFLPRLRRFCEHRLPGFRRYRQIRHDTLARERERLRVDEFMPRVLSSFVRNKLINDAYLPLIGANLAKQLGAAGAGKRTDLMGLLLLISPPGYGKTTLMEYVANRLGLVFMKVNGPALGHSVHSLDPSEAPNATARQEIEKINLALEMGNNVMLYLDDIQHTHPELLQKFISLCDAQRRIEGVWKGRTRTYDLRGKRFCVIMAGNPYTESGDKFQIPDMLANRADTYNLGDVLGGQEDAFSLSYIENAITSNEVLAPLAGRSQQDIYRLIKMARGEDIPNSQLEHNYSAVEINEIKAVFERLFTVQETLLAVNLEYIRSASMDDAFRTEPSFKLQGSYRNMAKLAEKIVPVMNDEELNRLIEDHYVGEAQTLTTGAETNMLKLRELRGTLSEGEAQRWAEIKKEYQRRALVGGSDDDPVSRVTGTLTSLGEQLEQIRDALTLAVENSAAREAASAERDAANAERANEQLAAQLKMQRESLATQREAAQAQRQSAEAQAAGVEAQREAASAQRLSAEANQGSLAERRKQTIVQERRVEQMGAFVPPGGAEAKPVTAPYHPPADATADPAWLRQHIAKLDEVLAQMASPNIQLEVHNQPPPGVEELLAQQVAIIERTLVPLVRTATQKLDDKHELMGKLDELLTRLGLLERQVTKRS